MSAEIKRLVAPRGQPVEDAIDLMQGFSCQRVSRASPAKHAGIRRRNPYHTRHTFACWRLAAGATPSFIANQMGHESSQMAYEVYSAWIEEMNGDQVAMFNNKLAL